MKTKEGDIEDERGGYWNGGVRDRGGVFYYSSKGRVSDVILSKKSKLGQKAGLIQKDITIKIANFCKIYKIFSFFHVDFIFFVVFLHLNYKYK